MSLRRSSTTESYEAVVGWLGRIGSARKGLKGVVSLDEVLSGATCSPISLKDFESFLIHQEFSVENLQFITWLANYTARFKKLPHYTQSQALPTLPMSPVTPSANRARAPPALARSDSTDSLGSDVSVQTPDKKLGKLPAEFEWMDKIPVRGREGGQEELQDEDEEGVWIGGQTRPSTSKGRGLFSSPPTISPISPWDTINPFDAPTSPISPISPGGTQTLLFPSRLPPPRRFPSTSATSSASTRPSRQREDSTTSSLRPFLRSTSHATDVSVKTDADLAEEFRVECERVWATFFFEGAAKELNVEESVRTGLRKGLDAGGWHPDLFAQAHKASRTMLLTHSLPSFLSKAGTNINRPKQVFWHLIGTLDLLLSLLIFLLCVFLAPSPSFKWRTLRLVGVVFGSFGAMQTYSAQLGFCTQVHSRGARQLHRWELEDVESGLAGSSASDGTFEIPLEPITPVTPSEPTSTTELVFPRAGAGARGGGEGKGRGGRPPPIFGPETVILDPKVLALQKKMVRDILVVGGVWAGLGVGVVLGVPGLG